MKRKYWDSKPDPKGDKIQELCFLVKALTNTINRMCDPELDFCDARDIIKTGVYALEQSKDTWGSLGVDYGIQAELEKLQEHLKHVEADE